MMERGGVVDGTCCTQATANNNDRDNNNSNATRVVRLLMFEIPKQQTLPPAR